MNTNIKICLIKLAAYYEKQLSDEQVSIYTHQLAANLTNEETEHACKLYIDDPKNEFFPRPVSKLISLIKTPVSSEDVAQNISSLLMSAERKYGAHWIDGYFLNGETVYQGKDCSYITWSHAALSVFGEIGLQIVYRYGNWKDFCINIYETPDGVVRAQIKNIALSLQNIVNKTGSYDAISIRPSVGLTGSTNILAFFKKTDQQ